VVVGAAVVGATVVAGVVVVERPAVAEAAAVVEGDALVGRSDVVGGAELAVRVVDVASESPDQQALAVSIRPAATVTGASR
jgi:hypothetical protein